MAGLLAFLVLLVWQVCQHFTVTSEWALEILKHATGEALRQLKLFRWLRKQRTANLWVI